MIFDRAKARLKTGVIPLRDAARFGPVRITIPTKKPEVTEA